MLIDSSGNTRFRDFTNNRFHFNLRRVTSTGHVYPASNTSVDLGAYGSAFRDVFASVLLGQNFRLASVGKNYTANSSQPLPRLTY